MQLWAEVGWEGGVGCAEGIVRINARSGVGGRKWRKGQVGCKRFYDNTLNNITTHTNFAIDVRVSEGVQDPFEFRAFSLTPPKA